MYNTGILSLLLISAVTPLMADTILLGDISLQPNAPVAGLTSIFLDNFTDLADLGCSPTFPACGGINISGLLTVIYQDSNGNTQYSSISVPSTGPGSTPIYEFNPAQITFESATLSGNISSAVFPLDGANTLVSTGAFVSDTLTPDTGFANISVSGQETDPVPEPTSDAVALGGLFVVGMLMVRRRTKA